MTIILLLASLITSSLYAPESSTQQLITTLTLPESIHTQEVKKLCANVFLDNNEAQTKNLIKFISKKYKKNDALEVLKNIIEWAAKNKYDITSFVKAIPRPTLRQNHHALKSRILIHAIYTQNNDIVKYLLPLFSNEFVATQKIEGKTFLEHVQAANNQEAINSITSIIKIYEKQLRLYRKLKIVAYIVIGTYAAFTAFIYIFVAYKFGFFTTYTISRSTAVRISFFEAPAKVASIL